MMRNVYLAIDFLVIAAIVVGYALWTFKISSAALRDWAAREGLEILTSSNRHLFRGPYFWEGPRNQAVYFIRARDSAGRVRSGWVRIIPEPHDRIEVTWLN
jgi:hypothetical protein